MFNRFNTRHLYFGVAVIFFLSFATVYSFYGNSAQRPWTTASELNQKPTIKKDTVIFEEIRYQCGNKVSTRIPTTSGLIGMEFSQLVTKYPPEAGWSIDDSKENILVLARLEDRVCRYHQDYRHLGESDGYLAIFEGPLGFNQKVLQREEVRVETLPAEMQKDLSVVMNFDDLDPDTQAKLKGSYEFADEQHLNMVLENFDE